MVKEHKTLLEVKNLSVSYGDQIAIDTLDLDLQYGQLLCLLGPSGCGKSTLLRAIAGFENLVGGSIMVVGQLLSTARTNLAPEKRNIGMLFQDVALFPHLDVYSNIVFGLHKCSHRAAKQRASFLLKLVGMAGFEARYPHELSGGQQQRVALARAMAPKPNLLLMDEPFSGLDAALREELVPEVAAILKQEGISAILVTHDQTEAFAFAEHVAIMNKGTIEQISSAYTIYHEPVSRFVADFVGEGDFISGEVVTNNRVDCALGAIVGDTAPYDVGSKVDIFVRPDDILYDDTSSIKGRIIGKRFRGTHFLYRIILPGGVQIACFADSHHDHTIGEDLGIALNMDHLLLFQ